MHDPDNVCDRCEKKDRRLDVYEVLHARDGDEEEGAVDDPVNGETQHLCRVQSRFRAHDVGDLCDAWEDRVQEDTNMSLA